MNGSKSTFKRKGYWLTAFAAAVLLAASPGTAQAQVEITGPDEVTEGETATYTVAIKGFIDDQVADGAMATVTLAPAPHDFFGQPSARRRMSYVPRENSTRLRPRREPGGRPQRPQPRGRSSARGGGPRDEKSPWSSRSSRGNHSRASVVAMA